MNLQASANLYPAISEADLLELPIPKLDLKVCGKVAASVQAAHAARREAQTQLIRVQRAADVAVEQGEPTALALLASPVSS